MKIPGNTIAAPAAICNQLTAGLLQFGHFIFHSGRTVPQLWQDQMILGIRCYLWPPPAVAPSPQNCAAFYQIDALQRLSYAAV